MRRHAEPLSLYVSVCLCMCLRPYLFVPVPACVSVSFSGSVSVSVCLSCHLSSFSPTVRAVRGPSTRILPPSLLQSLSLPPCPPSSTPLLTHAFNQTPHPTNKVGVEMGGNPNKGDWKRDFEPHFLRARRAGLKVFPGEQEGGKAGGGGSRCWRRRSRWAFRSHSSLSTHPSPSPLLTSPAAVT